MRERPGFFLMNKQSDFLCGYPKKSKNKFSDSGVTVKEYYFSEIFDSGERNMQWYKLVGRFSLPEGSGLRLYFYSSDSPEIEGEKGRQPIKDLLDSHMSLEKKQRLLSQISVSAADAAEEILLTSLRGRYFFFLAVGRAARSEYPQIERIKLCFAPRMWIDYLPEIYRSAEGDFTERYLAIFQSIFEELEESIDRSYENYSPDTVPPELLKWLSEWYCTTEPELWSAEQLRYILKNARRIYKNLGTAAVIRELLSLYLQRDVEIIEYWQKEDRELLKRYAAIKQQLFSDPYCFAVVVAAEAMSDPEYTRLMRIIDSCKPAYMSARVILAGSKLPKVSVVADVTRLTEDGGGLTEGIILA